MPDRGGRRRRASSRQAADRAAGDRAGAELRGRRASRGLCKNDIRVSPPCFLSDISGWPLSLVGPPPAGRRRRFLFSECRIGAVGGAGRAAARPRIEPPGTAPAPSYGVAAPVGGSAKMTLGVCAVLSLRHFGLSS